MAFTDPPKNPDPLGISAAVGIVCLIAGALLIFYQCACGPKPASYPAYCTEEAAFTARLLACVDDAAREAHDEPEFRNLSRVCRAAVHERCGITYVSAKDGGAP